MRILFLTFALIVIGLVFVGSSVSAQTLPSSIPGECDSLAECINFCLGNEDNFQICLNLLESNRTDEEVKLVLAQTNIMCGANQCDAPNAKGCACGRTYAPNGAYCFIDQEYVSISDDEKDCENVKKGLPPLAFSLPTSGVPGTGNQFLDTLQVLSNWIFAIMLATSVIFILMAALDFINSEGDPEKIKMARMKLVYSVIGIAAALAVFGFPTILRSVMGVN